MSSLPSQVSKLNLARVILYLSFSSARLTSFLVCLQVSEVSSFSAIEICVYMMDNKGLTLVLDEGRSTTSDLILDVVLDELSIPLRYKACFGIWLSSPLLHLQVR